MNVNIDTFDPSKIAARYYFGDLQYWRLPELAVEVLLNGYDGVALRNLAGFAGGKSIVESDLPTDEIDLAFREMGVAAPLSRTHSAFLLAVEAIERLITGDGNVFDVATHIRVHLGGSQNPSSELRRIAELSAEVERAPRRKWGAFESELRDAMLLLISIKQ